jgi:two-component system LytT family response regulator
MPLRVILADDEPLAIERVRSLLRGLDDVEIVGTARNGLEVVDLVAAQQPDLVLLDIQMPGRNGLAAAAALTSEQAPEIVFVTAHEHYAADAFDLQAADYLLKPVRFERLRLAIDRASRRRQNRALSERNAALEAENAALRNGHSEPAEDENRRDEAIWVQVRDAQVRVPVSDIEWIEAARDYATLHTALRSYMLRTTMTALEQRIDPAELVRVHRSAFVRPSAVVALQRVGRSHQIELAGGIVVPVGVNYLAALQARLGIARSAD